MHAYIHKHTYMYPILPSTASMREATSGCTLVYGDLGEETDFGDEINDPGPDEGP